MIQHTGDLGLARPVDREAAQDLLISLRAYAGREAQQGGVTHRHDNSNMSVDSPRTHIQPTPAPQRPLFTPFMAPATTSHTSGRRTALSNHPDSPHAVTVPTDP
jgi:hypothetical protein